jgi:hypothetical protein
MRSRERAQSVTIAGSSLGVPDETALPTVFVGGQLCIGSRFGVVALRLSGPLQTVVCTLAAGTARDLPVSVLQAGSLPVPQAVWVSYATCPEGHITVVTASDVICTRCANGTAPDMSRRNCVPCPQGRFALNNVNCTVRMAPSTQGFLDTATRL